MFYLRFSFLNAHPFLTLDKPNAAWKFLFLSWLPSGLYGQTWASGDGPSHPRPGSDPPEARGPTYPTSFPGKHSVLILLVMVPATEELDQALIAHLSFTE